MPAAPGLHHAKHYHCEHRDFARTSYRVVYVPLLKTRRTENHKTTERL